MLYCMILQKTVCCQFLTLCWVIADAQTGCPVLWQNILGLLIWTREHGCSTWMDCIFHLVAVRAGTVWASWWWRGSCKCVGDPDELWGWRTATRMGAGLPESWGHLLPRWPAGEPSGSPSPVPGGRSEGRGQKSLQGLLTVYFFGQNILS